LPNNDEIDTSSQFHQRFTSSFFADNLLKLQSQTVSKEKLHKTFSYEKAAI
jgi:hypothetical protein